MKDKERMTEDNETYTLTPWGCMQVILDDYGIDLTGITPKMGEHMVDDFLELMVKAGNIRRVEE